MQNKGRREEAVGGRQWQGGSGREQGGSGREQGGSGRESIPGIGRPAVPEVVPGKSARAFTCVCLRARAWASESARACYVAHGDWVAACRERAGEGVSKDRKGVSKDRKGVSQDIKGVSKDRKGVSKDRKGVLKDRKGVSKDRKGVSKDRKGVSKDRKGVSKDRKGVLKDRKGVSKDRKGAPSPLHHIAPPPRRRSLFSPADPRHRLSRPREACSGCSAGAPSARGTETQGSGELESGLALTLERA
jgi:hypothetical protein